MENTNNKTWCDKFGCEMSEHLKKYLNVFGITYDEQTGSYSCADGMLTEKYFGENMPVSGEDSWDYVNFYTSDGKIIARITYDGTVIFYGKDNLEKPRKIKYAVSEDGVFQIEYTPGNREAGYSYCLAISQDLLGNVMIAFGGIDLERINIERDEGTVEDYLDSLKAKIRKALDGDKMWPIVELLFSDPRISEKLNEFMQNMARSIDEAFEQKASELCKKYLRKSDELLDDYHRAFSVLEDFRDSCKRSIKGNAR